MRNIELLTKVRDLIKEKPRKHDQTSWGTIATRRVPKKAWEGGQAVVSCASACCVAGHACMLAGDSALLKDWNTFTNEKTTYFDFDQVVTKDGETLSVPYRARELLGLTYEESEILFSGEHDRKTVLKMLDTLIAGHDLDWGLLGD